MPGLVLLPKSVVRLVALLSCVFLVACQGQNADPVEERSQDLNIDEDVIVPPIAPDFGTSFIDVDVPLFALTNSSDSTLSMFDVKIPEDTSSAATTEVVRDTDSGLLLSLNTDLSNGDVADYSVMVDEDNIWVYDHQTKSMRILTHMTERVCAIRRVETVARSNELVDGIETDILRVLDDTTVIVETVAIDQTSVDCGTENENLRHFFELDVDISSLEIDEAVSPTPINSGLANAQLMVGLMGDQDAKEIDFGYLGYSANIKRLEFYNSERELVWYQDRSIEFFERVELPSGLRSPSTILNLTYLGDFRYLLQLGLDMFLVDSSEEVFSKVDLSSNVESSSGAVEVTEVFSDRMLKLELLEFIRENKSTSYLGAVKVVQNDNTLLILNGHKIYRYDLPSVTAVSGLGAYRLDNIHSLGLYEDDLSYSGERMFSQYDLLACDNEDLVCLNAHDLDSDSWQFVVACDESSQCQLPNVMSGYCRSSGNNSIDLPTCSSKLYQHLGDLDDSANNAEVIGYMRYGPDYVSEIDFDVLPDSLLIRAQMRDRDVLLRYFYDVPLSDPKILREQALFGRDRQLLDIKFNKNNDNLFVDSRVPGGIRNNECYKNYQRVRCDLGSSLEGDNNNCTGKDLELGRCFDEFREFSSKAVFCSSSELENRACNESSKLGVLPVEDSQWLSLRVQDMLNEAHMAILVGDNAFAISEDQLGEGALFNPELFVVNSDTGLADTKLGDLSGRVEAVVRGVVERSVVDSNSTSSQMFKALIDVVSDEVVDRENSNLAKYAIFEVSDSDDESQNVTVIQEVLARGFARSDSTIKKTAEELQAEAVTVPQ